MTPTPFRRIVWGEQEILLYSSCSIFLPAESTLVIADLHIGKAGHFRKNGIPLPKMVNQNNYWKLTALIAETNPSSIVFLGDLFHSEQNDEWEEFVDVLNNYPAIKRILVSGNHDIFSPSQYLQSDFVLCDILQCGKIIFTHELLEDLSEDYLNVAGHIHPAVYLSGGVDRGVRLPCFYLIKNQLVIPAFGEFTGMKVIRPSRQGRVFAIIENEIMDLSDQ